MATTKTKKISKISLVEIIDDNNNLEEKEPIKRLANRNICRNQYFTNNYKSNSQQLETDQVELKHKKLISFHEFKHFTLPKDRADIIKERESLSLTCLIPKQAKVLIEYSDKKLPIKTSKKVSHTQPNNTNTIPTILPTLPVSSQSGRHDVVDSKTFYSYLPSNFRWPDNGEERNYDYARSLNKLAFRSDSNKFRASFIITIIEMMSKLKTAINRITGALDSVERPMDVLLHIILKGKDFYNASCIDPEFCLYLIDNDAELCPKIWHALAVTVDDLYIPNVIDSDFLVNYNILEAFNITSVNYNYSTVLTK